MPFFLLWPFYHLMSGWKVYSLSKSCLNEHLCKMRGSVKHASLLMAVLPVLKEFDFHLSFSFGGKTIGREAPPNIGIIISRPISNSTSILALHFGQLTTFFIDGFSKGCACPLSFPLFILFLKKRIRDGRQDA